MIVHSLVEEAQKVTASPIAKLGIEYAGSTLSPQWVRPILGDCREEWIPSPV
jgi:hypothetical protein